jgi:hypothetical protein
MHPVEEDSRFAIQPVYPDRQALCAEGEEHGKKQPSRLRAGREVASGRAVSGRRRLFLESWDQTRQKNERGWFWTTQTAHGFSRVTICMYFRIYRSEYILQIS